MAAPHRKKKRKSVLLALGWNVFDFNIGVAEFAKKENWILNDVMCHSGKFPAGWQGDGIITHVNSAREKPLIHALRSVGVPVVNLGSFHAPFIRSRVVPDNIRIGQLAAEHVLSRGFEHFAFYRCAESPVVLERMKGFVQTIESAQKQCQDLFFDPGKNSAGKGILQTTKLLPWLAKKLGRLPKPVAVMAQHDGEANDVVRAALSVGLKIPEDVAVIGVDNDPVYSTLGPVPLTSVESNRRLAGFRAAEILDRIIGGERWIEKTVLISPDEVVVRTSTDIVAVDDPNVCKALRFIWSNYRTPISVEDVVAVSGVSRRGLYTRFEAVVGHPIYEELMRLRLDHAKRLLRESTHKLQFIADECGLIDAERLSKSFKRFLGISPQHYRNQHQTQVTHPE
jgi:LacI family transcriptional regulator